MKLNMLYKICWYLMTHCQT